MMTSAQVCRRIEEVGIVPIIRAPSAAVATRAAEAILAGGISILEITMTVPDAVGVMGALRRTFGDRVLVGAGTVLDADTVGACVDAGAMFIVSPGFDAGTVEAARGRGVAVMPGALTPTEVMAAVKAGADMIKIFPCSAVGGPKYLRALRGPFPGVKFLATGGVNAATASDYILAGAAALGVGSELVDTALLEAGRDEVVTERARQLEAAVRAARSTLSR